MKYLIVLLVLVVVAWFVLRERRSRPGTDSRAAKAPQAQQVVACQHCGVHLPRIDSVEDGNGAFCSEAHRLAGPRAS